MKLFRVPASPWHASYRAITAWVTQIEGCEAPEQVKDRYSIQGLDSILCDIFFFFQAPQGGSDLSGCVNLCFVFGLLDDSLILCTRDHDIPRKAKNFVSQKELLPHFVSSRTVNFVPCLTVLRESVWHFPEDKMSQGFTQIYLDSIQDEDRCNSLTVAEQPR